MITGIILTHLPHWSLFMIMMAAIVICLADDHRGMSVKREIACQASAAHTRPTNPDRGPGKA